MNMALTEQAVEKLRTEYREKYNIKPGFELELLINLSRIHSELEHQRNEYKHQSEQIITELNAIKMAMETK